MMASHFMLNSLNSFSFFSPKHPLHWGALLGAHVFSSDLNKHLMDFLPQSKSDGVHIAVCFSSNCQITF